MKQGEELICDIKKLFCESLPDANLYVYETLDSTNTEAKRYAKRSTENKESFFIALSQTAGRGRMGRSFQSKDGGLYLSYLFYPEMPCSDSILITVYSAVCLCETIETLFGLKPEIKWVNDVLVNGKKIAGILTEGEVSSDGKSFSYAVVGIGVNVLAVDFPDELSCIATDLETVCGKRVPISELAALLSKKLAAFDVSLAKDYIKRYKSRSAVIGKAVRVLSREGEYYAKALDIDDNGALIVENEFGAKERLISGEISIKL